MTEIEFAEFIEFYVTLSRTSLLESEIPSELCETLIAQNREIVVTRWKYETLNITITFG